MTKNKESIDYANIHIRCTPDEHNSVKKATLDFKMGFRDILLLGLKTLKSEKTCKVTSSKIKRAAKT